MINKPYRTIGVIGNSIILEIKFNQFKGMMKIGTIECSIFLIATEYWTHLPLLFCDVATTVD